MSVPKSTARSQQARARGLCGDCHQPSPHHYLCFPCRLEKNKRSAERYAARKRRKKEQERGYDIREDQ